MIEVEVWSDFACPFCAIGKRQFDLALQKYPQKDNVKVTFKSFELDPNSPKSQTEKITEILSKKYGQTLEWAQKANERVTKMAADCGMTFHMEKIVPTNSFDAHRLAHLGASKGLQTQIQDRLFQAYFTEGKDIAKVEVLADLGAAAGLSRDEIHQMLMTDQFIDEVRSDEAEARQLGIQGVPFFIFNRRLGVSGAQPIDVFLQAFDEALKPAP